MTFEVDDFVRVIAINETGRVVEEATKSIDGKMRYAVSLPSCKHPMRYSDDELELVGHYHKSKYKDGDRVRFTRGRLDGREGFLQTRTDAFNWVICLDDGDMRVERESDFELVDKLDETLSAEEIDKCIENCADEFATVVHKGERYNPSKVDGIVKTFTEQIRVAYERGYKDGNFDGQTYAYNKGYADGRSEQHKEDSTYNTYLRGYNDAIDDIMKRAREMSGKVVKNDE